MHQTCMVGVLAQRCEASWARLTIVLWWPGHMVLPVTVHTDMYRRFPAPVLDARGGSWTSTRTAYAHARGGGGTPWHRLNACHTATQGICVRRASLRNCCMHRCVDFLSQPGTAPAALRCILQACSTPAAGLQLAQRQIWLRCCACAPLGSHRRR